MSAATNAVIAQISGNSFILFIKFLKAANYKNTKLKMSSANDDDDNDTEYFNLPVASITDADDGDDADYNDPPLVFACVVEEPSDNNYESNEHAAQSSHDALVEEMKRDEQREEEKRAAANGVKLPSTAKAAPKRQRAPSTKPRKRAAKAPSAGLTKAKKLYAKQMRAVTRDADKIIEATMNDNESEDVRKIRVESQHAYQRALSEMRELKQLLDAGTRTKEAVKLHSEMVAKLRRLNQLQKETTSTSTTSKTTAAADAMQDMILGDCIEILADQSSAISKLHERVNKLVELYCKMTAKCEAATRRAFDSNSHYSQRAAPAMPQLKTDPEQAKIQNGVANGVVPHQPQQTPPPTGNTASMFSIRTGNGFYDLTTPDAPQIVRGRPGATYIPFSVARRKGSAQQLAQSDSIARAHAVQRWAKLAKKKRAYSELILALPHLNGDDALADQKSLGAPESASLARITAPAAKSAKKPRKPKAITAGIK